MWKLSALVLHRHTSTTKAVICGGSGSGLLKLPRLNKLQVSTSRTFINKRTAKKFKSAKAAAEAPAPTFGKRLRWAILSALLASTLANAFAFAVSSDFRDYFYDKHSFTIDKISSLFAKQTEEADSAKQDGESKRAVSNDEINKLLKLSRKSTSDSNSK